MHDHVFSKQLLLFHSRNETLGLRHRENAQRYDRKVAASDPQKLLEYCRDLNVRRARQQSDSGVCQKSLRWNRQQYLNQFPPRQQKNAATLCPGNTQQLLCFLLRIITALGGSCYAMYVSGSVRWTVKSKYRDSRAITHSTAGFILQSSLSALRPTLTPAER